MTAPCSFCSAPQDGHTHALGDVLKPCSRCQRQVRTFALENAEGDTCCLDCIREALGRAPLYGGWAQ